MLEYKKDAGKIEDLINDYLKETNLQYLRCKTGIKMTNWLDFEERDEKKREYWVYELYLQQPKLQVGSIFYWPSSKKIEVNREVLCEPRTLVLRKDYIEKIGKDLQALVNIPENIFLKQYKKRRIW